MQGGAHGQFAAIPLNLLRGHKKAAYVDGTQLALLQVIYLRNTELTLYLHLRWLLVPQSSK